MSSSTTGRINIIKNKKKPLRGVLDFDNQIARNYDLFASENLNERFKLSYANTEMDSLIGKERKATINLTKNQSRGLTRMD